MPDVQVVDLDDPDAVAGLTRTSWTPGDPVLIGYTAGRNPAGQPAVLDRATVTLVLAGTGTSDRRTVEVEDPAQEARRLVEAISATPNAANTLDGLLRTVAALPEVGTALVAESLAYSTLLAGAEFARWLADAPVRSASPAVAEPVRLRRDGELLCLELDMPERRNAFSAGLRSALVDALDVPLLDATITRVELSGAGPCFSSGGDLAEFGTVSDPPAGHLLRMTAHPGPVLAQLRDRMGADLVVRVHGRCVGAGVELPAFAGAVLADPGTTFRLPEVGMGLVPGAGGTVSLTRRIGRWRTAYLCLSGSEIDAGTAHDWGLVDHVR